MTPATPAGPSTRRCSAQISPLSSTCAICVGCPARAFASLLCRPRSLVSEPGRYGPSPMSFRQTSVSGFPAVALRSPFIELVAVPALGMKLTNLRRLAGREWLWRSDQIPLAPPKPGSSYVDTADSGGWDECFPTVGACPIPGAPPGKSQLPDHGELWSAAWTSSVFDGPEGTTIAGTAHGAVFPYEFHRQ